MDGIRQHKAMAMGKAIPQGGGDGMPAYANPVPHPDRNMATDNTLSDGGRGVGKLIGGGGSRMGATPHPDHGPHHHRHAGTGRSAY